MLVTGVGGSGDSTGGVRGRVATEGVVARNNACGIGCVCSLQVPQDLRKRHARATICRSRRPINICL